ncbi:MAG: hypothetical protein WDA47_03235 [Bacilli bacterium]|nr:hypothetical protein [Candidatus Saccharicenans sp.]
MKPENYKLRLRRARKLAVKTLESSGYLAFEATNRKNQYAIVAIDPATTIAKIIWVCLEAEDSSKEFDTSLPPNIEQQVWIKKSYINEFRILV